MADELPDRLWVVTHGRFREAHFYKDLAEQVAAHFTSSPASITEFVDASRLTAAQEQVERLREALRARMVTDYYCEQCERGWMEENVEEHAPGCLAAKDRQ